MGGASNFWRWVQIVGSIITIAGFFFGIRECNQIDPGKTKPEPNKPEIQRQDTIKPPPQLSPCSPGEPSTAKYAMPERWNEAFSDEFSTKISSSQKWNMGQVRWEIENGWLARTDQQSGRDANISTKNFFPLGAAADFYVFKDDSVGGITCRLAGDILYTNRYMLYLTFCRSDTNKLQKNESTVVTNSEFFLSPCEWHHILYSWKDDTIAVQVDDNSFMQYSDSASDLRPDSVAIVLGSLGGKGKIYFDNIYIYSKSRRDSIMPDPATKTIINCYWVTLDSELSISARSVDTNTGIMIAVGDSLLFTASSTVQLFRNYNIRFGPKGRSEFSESLPYGGRTICPNAPLGALIGKIGRYGDWFLIGDSTLGVADASDTLFLSVNDFEGIFADNNGAFKIALKRRQCQQLL